MGDAEALRLAVDLLHVPSRIRMIRANPLPRGVPLLLRIAADEPGAAAEAARMTDRSPDVVREAAEFFIEQILLCPEADSYRVLGTGPHASGSELRLHMALLVKWLHPDKDRNGQQSLFVNRVTMAWDDLKTPERRATYDQQRRALTGAGSAGRRDKRSRTRSRKASPPDMAVRHRHGLLRRALHFLFGGGRH